MKYLAGIFLIIFFPFFSLAQKKEIDRKAVVERNNIIWNDLYGVTTLGNGEFAFNCDATGLQTFAGNTLSNWGWHSDVLPKGMHPEDRIRTVFETNGRKRNYLFPWAPEQEQLVKWLDENPHRMNLGRIALRGEDGRRIDSTEIKVISRKCDLWNGRVESRFEYKGIAVLITTVCDPVKDAVAVRIKSALLKNKKLGIAVAFPYPVAIPEPKIDLLPKLLFAGNFKKTNGHTTIVNWKTESNTISIDRKLDDGTAYHVQLSNVKGLRAQRGSKEQLTDLSKAHSLFLTGSGADEAEFTVLYTNVNAVGDSLNYDKAVKEVDQGKTALSKLSFEKVKSAASEHWMSYWNNGGFVDLSASKDPRWKELERRIILSQFLTAANSSGSKPPAEAGLYNVDRWAGKFHLEMTAWHGAHFVMWNRPDELKGWVKWFQTIGLKSALAEAKAEGWAGAKWLKTPDPYGRWESWDHGTNRVTQNVHPFYFAELMYRVKPDRETLYEWKDILFETTRMMLDFVAWDKATNRYILGPGVMSGAEGNSGFESWNATSELNYWAMSFSIAKKWRERLGLPADEKLDHVIAHLSKPAVVGGVYIDAESHPEIWNKTPEGHYLRAAWLEIYGCVAGPLVQTDVMKATYEKVSRDLRSKEWKGNLWGCDYPMLAMTAARLGKPQEAIDWLLYDAPLNNYTPNGYNAGWYLPGNGGLLWAVALMTAGWDQDNGGVAAGFPTNGSWIVQWEGLNKVP